MGDDAGVIASHAVAEGVGAPPGLVEGSVPSPGLVGGSGLGRKPPPHCRQSTMESMLELNSAPSGWAVAQTSSHLVEQLCPASSHSWQTASEASAS
eukprot:scaffold11849_cov66-Phaeocystis_antarctica.AAC.2